MSTFYDWGDWDLEQLNNLLNVTWLRNEAGI